MIYESLLEDFEIVVGDSSEIYMVEAPEVGEFSSDWEAHVAVTTDLEEQPILLRPVPKNLELQEDGEIIEPADKYFVVQLSPTETSILESDTKYWFVVQVKNDVIGYKQELIQCRMKAKKQGIFR